MPKTDEAARYGITTDQISEAVRVATIGDVAANLAKFNAGDRLIPSASSSIPMPAPSSTSCPSLTVVSASGSRCR